MSNITMTPAQIADRLGELKNLMTPYKALEKEEKALKEAAKAVGARAFSGDRYTVTISESVASVIDQNALRIALGDALADVMSDQTRVTVKVASL